MEIKKIFTSIGTRTHAHTHDGRSPYQLNNRGWFKNDFPNPVSEGDVVVVVVVEGQGGILH